MSEYSLYDFTETVNHYDSPINERQIESVLYAYGDSSEGYGEWHGGFILRLKDESVVLVTGWCDTSGWGCQDGMTLYRGTIDEMVAASREDEFYTVPTLDEWDQDPIDLNRYLRGETKD